MQSWQIKALKLEASALKFLDGIIADYGPYIFFRRGRFTNGIRHLGIERRITPKIIEWKIYIFCSACDFHSVAGAAIAARHIRPIPITASLSALASPRI